MRRTAKRLRAMAALAGLALLPAFVPAQAQAAGTRPFSVTITHVGCVDPCSAEGLEAALEGHPDFYAKVFINGVEHRTPTIDNVFGVDPYWVVSTELPDTIQNVPVTIQIWDTDDTSGDDLGDDTPHDDDNNLDFTVSYFDGKWRDTATNKTDNVNWPQSCSSGDGDAGSDEDEPAVKVCWDVSTTSTSGDADGDGLLDGWERNGYNEDGDGTIDVDLPAMRAKADHKDVFLELDWTTGRAPTRAGIQAMKKAFAAAPPNVGSTASSRRAPNGGFGVNAPPNPDGTNGINLHVDTGGLLDPGAVKAGRSVRVPTASTTERTGWSTATTRRATGRGPTTSTRASRTRSRRTVRTGSTTTAMPSPTPRTPTASSATTSAAAASSPTPVRAASTTRPSTPRGD